MLPERRGKRKWVHHPAPEAKPQVACVCSVQYAQTLAWHTVRYGARTLYTLQCSGMPPRWTESSSFNPVVLERRFGGQQDADASPKRKVKYLRLLKRAINRVQVDDGCSYSRCCCCWLYRSCGSSYSRICCRMVCIQVLLCHVGCSYRHTASTVLKVS